MTATKNAETHQKKYFTVAQAQRMLPSISKILARIISVNKALDLLSSIEIEVYDDDYSNIKRVTKLNKEFHKLSYEFYANIEKLEDKGCLLKDIELGIVDFYSIYNNKEILLCWKFGEQEIGYFHEADADFNDRKPLDELPKKNKGF